MRGLRGYVRLRRAVPVVVVITVIAVGVVVWLDRRSEQLADNRAQLKSACAGLLPQGHLGQFLPKGEAGSLHQYGTMLDPGQQSRVLLDCRLSWGGDEEVTVRANALPARAEEAPGASDSDFPLRLPPSAQGTVKIDRSGAARAIASLVVECPKGLTGRVRPSKDLQVAVGLPVKVKDAYASELSPGNRRLVAGAAVRIANWITDRQKCGGAPLSTGPAAPVPASADAPRSRPSPPAAS